LEFPYEEKSIETLDNYEVTQGTFVGSFVQIVEMCTNPLGGWRGNGNPLSTFLPLSPCKAKEGYFRNREL
jgi:hypothetical protein